MKVKITKVPSLFKNGGDINIKPSHKGLFTEKANRHDMGVLLFASHVLANKEDYPTSTIRLANFARNATKFKHSFGGSILYADGGLFEGSHTHGVDFIGGGDFTEFNTGSSHENNGNEGIPQGVDNNGTPNLVEEGETKYNDYIFSTRLTIPTRKELDKELKSLPENEGGDSQRGWEISILKKWAGKTYAYASKHAYKEAEERPNDAYSNETLEEILGVLKNSLEKQRAIEQSKKEAKEELELLKDMSDKDYADAKELQELQLEAQQQAEMQLILLLQAQAELQALMQQLMALMSPEELQAYMLLIQLQLMPQQGYAEGGLLSEEEQAIQQQLIAASYYQYLLLTKDTNKMKSLLLRLSQYSQLIQQLPYELQKIATLKVLLLCLYEAAMEDLDFINQLLLATKAYQQFAEGGMLDSEVIDSPLIEETPHDELIGINPTQNVEEMSTSLLNETIDLIYQWAKLNGNRELAKRARKAKKMPREEKEDFVDEALEEVDLIRYQQLEELRTEELLIQLLMTPEVLVLQEQLMSQDELSEAMANLELNAQMLLPQLFANGGNLFAEGDLLFKDLSDLDKYYLDAFTKYISTVPNYNSSRLNSYYLTGKQAREWINQLAASKEAKDNALANMLKYSWGDNTLDWSDSATWEFKNKYNPNGSVTESSPYLELWKNDSTKTDGLWGIKHIPDLNTSSQFNINSSIQTPESSVNDTIPEETNGLKDKTATTRYFILDKDNHNATEEDLKNKSLVAVPKGYKLSTTKPVTFGDTTYEFYEPYDLENRYFTKEGIDYRNTLNTLDKALFDLDPRGYLELLGFRTSSGKDEYDDKNGIKRTTYIIDNAKKDPIPRYNSTGDAIALGLTGLGLAHNIFSPIDYSSRDALIGLANRLGNFSTVIPELLGNYVTPRRFDRNYWNTKALANNAALLASIDNSSAGNRSMTTALRLAANLNYINTLGELARQGELFNADRELQEATFNRGTNQFNAESALKAAMANQDAYSRAQQRFGEYYTKGLTMAESAKLARDAAINAGLSLVAAGTSALFLNKWLNDLLGWRGRRVNAPGAEYGENDPLFKSLFTRRTNQNN